MPNSAFLIDIIKNLARGCQEAGCSEVNVAVVQTLSATYEILGRFFSFPASKDRSSSGSISAGLWGSRRNKHTPTPPLAVVWLLDGKGAECCLLNRSGWMHGWMGDRRGWMGRKKWHPGRFIYSACIHSHPRYLWCKFCPRIWAMPLGKFIVCVFVWVFVVEEIFVCDLSTLFTLISLYLLSIWKFMPAAVHQTRLKRRVGVGASQGWRRSPRWCLTWWLNLSVRSCCETNVCSIPASQLLCSIRYYLSVCVCSYDVQWGHMFAKNEGFHPQLDWWFAVFWQTLGSVREICADATADSY